MRPHHDPLDEGVDPPHTRDTFVQWRHGARSCVMTTPATLAGRSVFMFTFTLSTRRVVLMVSCAAAMTHGAIASAQESLPTCTPAQVIPLTGPEPAPSIVVGKALAEPLATRRVAVIPYCANHMRIVPVFGTGALSVSPRAGHVHVRVDGASWVWADASGTPIILAGLAPGRHMVQIELVDANHGVVDKGTTSFEVPEQASPAVRH
jgi:hypothetical protein